MTAAGAPGVERLLLTEDSDASASDVSAKVAAVAEALMRTGGAVDITRHGLALPAGAVAELVGRAGSFVLTDPHGPGPMVRTGHGRVLAVATPNLPVARPTTSAVGLLRVAAHDRSSLAAALVRASNDTTVPRDAGAGAFEWILQVAVRSGIVVTSEPVAPWPWRTSGDPPQVDQQTAERIRLTRANRADDSWYSVTVLRRLSKPVTAFAAARGWSPNAITVASLVIGLAAAGFFALGSRWALVAGAVLLQVSLVVDCADGEVARLTGRFSRTGAWLDAVTDRVKEFAAYAGLAAGAAAISGIDLWWAAAGTMTLQTVRHLTDYTFDQVQRGWEVAEIQRPLQLEVTAPPEAAAGPPSASGLSAASGIAAMLRRTVFLPIGERWLLISLSAPVLGPVWTFALLIGVGVLSLAYATVGRALRTRAWTGGPVAMLAITHQLDTAPFGLPLPLGGRSGTFLLAASGFGSAGVTALVFEAVPLAGGLLLVAALGMVAVRVALFRPAWAAPAAVAALEMVPWLVAGIVLAPTEGQVWFALLFVIAFHKYDLLYRAVAGWVMPTWLLTLSGGAPVRLVVLAVVLLAAPAVLPTVAALLAVYLALVTIVVASAQWLSGQSADQS